MQPCSKFALHPKLEFLRELYEDGDAAFIANIGSLVEPLTGASFTDKSGRTPPQPFAHNVAQQSARTVHPQHSGAKGVLGRMLDALSSQAPPHRTGAFSIGRNGQILESEGRAPDIISEKHGEMRFVGDDASGTLTRRASGRSLARTAPRSSVRRTTTSSRPRWTAQRSSATPLIRWHSRAVGKLQASAVSSSRWQR